MPPQNRPAAFIPLVLHFAFITAIPIYGFIYQFVLLPGAHPAPSPTAFTIFAVLLMISLTSIALAMFLPERLASRVPQPGASTPSRQQVITTATVIQSALLESIAIYGLIGVFLGFFPWMSYTLFSLSLIALAAFTPRVFAWCEEIK